ncbi:ferredoxin [Streptomyces sp. SID13031]|uniref:ferredoxin n=1 Tax=Streptomyces sp. SID13031 TaxID=2706046 RepID=UPI0013CC34FC|nr:ferredoxin [Streptomyces sp. SID13031]NEA35264.1 ferredoxin [Streptomyces sp. SID13031]
MDVKIDEEECVGAGQCVLAAPDVFDQRDEDGVAILLQTPTDEQHGPTREAALLCPARAIHLSE